MTKGFKIIGTKSGERAIVRSARNVVVYADDVRANDLFPTREAAERAMFAFVASIKGKTLRAYHVAAN